MLSTVLGWVQSEGLEIWAITKGVIRVVTGSHGSREEEAYPRPGDQGKLLGAGITKLGL